MPDQQFVPPLALLRDLPALHSCTAEELAVIADLVEPRDVPEGTILIEQSARATEAFVIVAGWAAVMVHGEPIAALGPGQLVGEIALLDAGRRTATVVAKTPMSLLAIGLEAFDRFAAQTGVAREMSRTLAERLRHTDDALARRRPASPPRDAD